ncbi:MAG TPA: hypothetical protein H9675_05315 [Firmicutes bacterium]|nr:hypothetical protein [Bacillota bacterium]
MAEAYDTYRIIYQNLIDAGCNENMIEKCMVFVKQGKAFDMLPILSKHRKSLLASVHIGQKQIDCLDYLIYSLKKQK